jgi:hypothetical protein
MCPEDLIILRSAPFGEPYLVLLLLVQNLSKKIALDWKINVEIIFLEPLMRYKAT